MSGALTESTQIYGLDPIPKGVASPTEMLGKRMDNTANVGLGQKMDGKNNGGVLGGRSDDTTNGTAGAGGGGGG